MSQLILTDKNEIKIPYEILCKILYEMKGLEHPNSSIMLEHFRDFPNQKCCFICHNKNDSLSKSSTSYFNHHYHELNYWKKNIIDKYINNKLYICWDCAH